MDNNSTDSVTVDALVQQPPMQQPPMQQPPVQQAGASIWTKGFISLFITCIMLNVGQYMSNSILPVYMDSIGLSAAVVGLVLGTFAFSIILFRLVSAPVMDTYNRKYVVISSTIILSVAFFGFSIAKSVPLLICFRLIQGCGAAFGNACCLTIVADMLPKEKYSSGIGYFFLAPVLGQALGPFIGLLLLGQIGYSATFIVTACLMLLTGVLTSRLKISYTRTKKFKPVFSNIIAKEVFLPTVLLILISICIGAVSAFLVLFARNRGVTSNIGLFFTVSAGAMVISRPYIGRLTDKFGFVKMGVPLMICTIIMLFVTSISASLWCFLIAAVFSAFGYYACQPALQALAMKAVTGERRGAASATSSIGVDAGVLIGSSTAGSLVQAFGYVPMWRLLALAPLFGILVIILFRRRINGIEKSFSETV